MFPFLPPSPPPGFQESNEDGIGELSENAGPPDLDRGSTDGLDPPVDYQRRRVISMETCKRSSPSHIQQAGSAHSVAWGNKEDYSNTSSTKASPRASGSEVGVVSSSSEEVKLPAKIVVEVEVEPCPQNVEPNIQGVEPLNERVWSVVQMPSSVLEVEGPVSDEPCHSEVRGHEKLASPVDPTLEVVQPASEAEEVWSTPEESEVESTAIIAAAEAVRAEPSPKEPSSSNIVSTPKETSSCTEKVDSDCIEVEQGHPMAESSVMEGLTEACSSKDISTVVSVV